MSVVIYHALAVVTAILPGYVISDENHDLNTMKLEKTC